MPRSGSRVQVSFSALIKSRSIAERLFSCSTLSFYWRHQGPCAKPCVIRSEDNILVRKIVLYPGQLTHFERLIRETHRSPGRKHWKRQLPVPKGFGKCFCSAGIGFPYGFLNWRQKRAWLRIVDMKRWRHRSPQTTDVAINQ